MEDNKKEEEMIKKLQRDIELLNAKIKASNEAMIKESEKPINTKSNKKKGIDLSFVDGNAVVAFIVLLLFLIPIGIPFIYLLFTAGVGTSLLKFFKVLPPNKLKDKKPEQPNPKDAEKFLNYDDIKYYDKLAKKFEKEAKDKHNQITYLKKGINDKAMGNAGPTKKVSPKKGEQPRTM